MYNEFKIYLESTFTVSTFVEGYNTNIYSGNWVWRGKRKHKKWNGDDAWRRFHKIPRCCHACSHNFFLWIWSHQNLQHWNFGLRKFQWILSPSLRLANFHMSICTIRKLQTILTALKKSQEKKSKMEAAEYNRCVTAISSITSSPIIKNHLFHALMFFGLDSLARSLPLTLGFVECMKMQWGD